MALQLARRGMKTLVIERDGIAFNASAYAWGGLSAHFGSGVPGPMTDHYRSAIAQHIQLYDELNSTSTLDWQLQRVTSLSLADNDENASLLGNDVEWMQSEGFEAEMIASETIYDLEPAIRAWHGSRIRRELRLGTRQSHIHQSPRIRKPASGSDLQDRPCHCRQSNRQAPNRETRRYSTISTRKSIHQL